MADTWQALFDRAPEGIDEEAVVTALRKRRESAETDGDDRPTNVDGKNGESG